jgi:hypothetical protein
MTHPLVFKKRIRENNPNEWRTTLPLGSFLFVFTSHNFCVFELALYSLTTVVCPVRHPLDYHYFTFTKVCVSGSTPSQLSLFHFYYGAACPVRHPFNCHYFTFTMVLHVRFDTLLIVIISLLLWFVSGSTPFQLSLFHFYYRVLSSGSTCFRLSLFHFYYGVRPGLLTLSIVITTGVSALPPFRLLSLREWVRIKLCRHDG